jgi:two-component system NtrC family sensor kinase
VHSGRFGEIAEYLVRKLPIGVVLFDRDLHVRFTNDAVQDLVPINLPIDEVLRRATVESQYENWTVAVNKVLRAGQQVRFTNINCRSSGNQDRLVNLTLMPVPCEQGASAFGGMLVVEDVTLQATMEKRLMVSERLAAVGKLAARVAHELNNPLDGILRYINLAIRVSEQGDGARAVRYLAESRKGLLRMTQIIGELLEFSRTTHSVYEQTTINQLVEDAVKVMEAEAARVGVTMILSLESKMPPVRASNLFQVFCNLTKNAVDAMQTGGTLTITTQLAEQWLVIRFEDTGPGLPEEVERLFQPFYTTKEPGKGTGLGLAVSRDIVERYNGQLTAENRPSGGATFVVRVPLSSVAVPSTLQV